jgi:hypothetical protein
VNSGPWRMYDLGVPLSLYLKRKYLHLKPAQNVFILTKAKMVETYCLRTHNLKIITYTKNSANIFFRYSEIVGNV